MKKTRSMLLMGLLLAAAFSNASAQSNLRLAGQVVDAESGMPIAGATIQVVGSSRQARTDLSGRFAVSYLPAGDYQVLVEAPGYQPQSIPAVHVAGDFPVWLNISLFPENLALDTVEVDAGGVRAEPIPGTLILEGRRLEVLRRLGLRQLLEQVAGLSVEAPGSSGSSATIRIHGSRANQVLVLLDGQRLNLPATGEVDIERIPLDQVERVEITRHGDYTRYGGQAYAGVVHFQTRRWVHHRQLTLFGAGGSFHSGSATLAGQWTGRGWQGSGQWVRRYGRQDFPYLYQGEQVRRENAWFSRTGTFVQLTRGNRRVLGSLSWEWQRVRRGLPSAFFNEMDPAGAWMAEHLASINGRLIGSLSRAMSLRLQLAWNRVQQHFVNTRAPSTVLRYHTRQWNETGEIRLALQWQPSGPWHSELGLQLLREDLRGENLLYPSLSIGTHGRWSRAIYWLGSWQLPGRLPFWGFLTLRGGLRLERYFDRPVQLFPQANLTLQPSFVGGLSLGVAVGRTARYPDFNSLFWKGDARARGNPDLLPEEKTYWLLEARWQGQQLFQPAVSLSYFRASLVHLIFWHRRFDGVWEPRNEDRARKEGLDVDVSLALLANHVQLSLAYSRLRALNLSPEPNRHGRRIVFTPDQTLNATLGLSLTPVRLSVRGRYVGSRETLPANPRDSRLTPYWLWDAHLELATELRRSRLQLVATINNLFATRYQLIYGYPMPGRTVSLGMRLVLPAPQ